MHLFIKKQKKQINIQYILNEFNIDKIYDA